MIEGVIITPLRQIRDDRGKVMKMLSRDDAVFREFGEIYFSTVHPRAVKGWHANTRMWLNYAVVYGEIKLVLFDDREGSPTCGEIQEIYLGPEEYKLVTVPPGIWNGFVGVSDHDAILANCSTLPHDPHQILRRDPHDGSIPYDWGRRDG